MAAVFQCSIMDAARSPLNQRRPSTPSEPQWDQEDPSDHDAVGQDEEHHQKSTKDDFDAWADDLDDQSLPDMNKVELRILHALLFGSGDDAFSVADELLAKYHAREAAFLASHAA